MKARLLLIPIVVLLTFSTGHAQVARWQLNNNANDASGNGITGTLMNSPTYTTDNMEGSHGLQTNGTNQYITFGNPSQLPDGTSARTITAWAKTSNTSGSRYIVAYGTNANSQAMFIGANGTSLVAGGWSNDITVNSFWTTGVWHHIALTYDGTTAKLYADGVQVASVAKTWNLVRLRAYIGRLVSNDSYWSGTIDDVRIYDTALSASQVLALATLPPAPTSASATASSSSTIDLTWSESATTETGFQIERSTTSGSGYALVNTAAASATSFQDAGLTPQTTYYYRMRTVADNANSAYTAQFSATTLIAPPTAPTGLGATAFSATQIDLLWTDASSTETGFEVERSTTSGSGFSLISTTAANATSFSDTGLSPSTTYYFRIRSKNAGGASAYTTESSATTLPATPNAPTGPSATSLSATSIRVDWTDASSNETGFEIERSLSAGSGFSLVTTTAPNTATFTDTGLDPETQYYYRVRAINGSATSSYTSVVNATTQSQSPPPVPTSPTATTSSPTSIVVGWTDGSNNETGFEVERSLAPGTGYSLITTTAPNATSYNDESLTPNTTYYYRIRSKNAAGTSSYTTVVNATTPLAPPAAPTSLSAIPSVSSINLSWTDNASNESQFIIERSISSGTGFTVLTTVTANTISYTDASITPGQPYFYRIKATNAGGNSSYADEVTATLNIAGVTQLCKGLYCDENGSVGVGTQVIPSGYKMSVKGRVMAEGVKVDLQSAWPDYVFEEHYQLKDLPSLRSYIDSTGHLPGMPTTIEVEKEGIDVGEINVKLLEKIEELSLYVIQMEERIRKLENENSALKSGRNRK